MPGQKKNHKQNQEDIKIRVYNAFLIKTQATIKLLYINQKFVGAIDEQAKNPTEFMNIIQEIAPPTEADFSYYNKAFDGRIKYEITKEDYNILIHN